MSELPSDERARWREQRRQAAADRAGVHERALERETARARELLAEFVAELRRRGVPPVELRATDGGARYRTGLRGWYLKQDGTLGVTCEGGYYVLAVPRSLRARLTGVRLLPADPPLQVGRGARDGESVELAELLRKRLAEHAPPG
ncbi:hypothetical protein [Kineococcus glutinatus]|uniref:Uncharacterized protein n=1 Tax=Kineococcus glutinatus TaxID=1070872 RepID=A0ABP9HAW9_9ACTN